MGGTFVSRYITTSLPHRLLAWRWRWRLQTSQWTPSPIPLSHRGMDHASLQLARDTREIKMILQVQELQFLNVWVRPLCEAKVDVTKEGVVIEVTKCVLEGSPEVKKPSSPSENLQDFRRL